MEKRIYILGVFLISLVLLMSLVSAATNADVAYIYKSKTDKNIVKIFEDLRIKIDYIKESSLPADLSNYKFIFIGDENFAKNIPVADYPSVIMNHYITGKVGLGKDGISRLVSTKPLSVNFKGDDLTVYSSAKDSRGVAIPYYYLDEQTKASSLSQYVGTYTTSSGENFGDVISLGSTGDKLANGDILQDNICFFGISETRYWTNDAESLFKDCLKHVFDYTTIPEPVITCTKDSDCGTNGLIGSTYCTSNNVFKNYITYKCHLPDTVESYCTDETSPQLVQECGLSSCDDGKCGEVTCNSNVMCDDSNTTTEDVCINPGESDSMCIYNIYNTYIKLISFVAIPSQNSVTLKFSATTDNNALIKGYLLSIDKQKWIMISSPITEYVFDGLIPSTSYTFYAKAIDNKNIPSDEMNVTVTTLDVPVTPPVVPSGGGSSSGGLLNGAASYCSMQWECGDWSECIGGTQSRTCSVPTGKCIPEVNKPIEMQSCVGFPETPSENVESSNVISNSGTEGNTVDTGSTTKPNSITGAAIAGLLGKYSWVGVILLLIIALAIYILVKKFGK